MDREQIQKILEILLGSKNVYYQPPATIKMRYDCIVYHRDKILTEYANNKPYQLTNRYMVTYVSPNPDDKIVEELAGLPMSTFDRHYVSDKLHHYVYTIFFEGGN